MMTPDDTELYEFNTHAFVVKIWLEEGLRWRGHITHIPSGERRYIEELGEIDDFILPYLEKMGVQPKTLERLCSRLRRKRSRRAAKGRLRPSQKESDGAGA
jgi:hypothetical protein